MATTTLRARKGRLEHSGAEIGFERCGDERLAELGGKSATACSRVHARFASLYNESYARFYERSPEQDLRLCLDLVYAHGSAGALEIVERAFGEDLLRRAGIHDLGMVWCWSHTLAGPLRADGSRLAPWQRRLALAQISTPHHSPRRSGAGSERSHRCTSPSPSYSSTSGGARAAFVESRAMSRPGQGGAKPESRVPLAGHLTQRRA